MRRTIMVARQVQGVSAVASEVAAPKYGSERVVYTPDGLATMLAAHLETCGCWGEDRWLFGVGQLLNRHSAGHEWRRIRRRTGLDGYTLHSLRHFYASGLIAAGCDVVTVQRALGHSSPTVTLSTYAHLWPRAEDRTSAAAASLMTDVLAPADSLRTAELSATL
jgi:integrase